ncbi:Alpha/Beta hydrolase protein [Halenospora varia]|nr:Alpha/Beta hydrolase protein [Halenospora varia]
MSLNAEQLLALGKPDREFEELLDRREPYIILDDDFNVPRLREQEKAYMKSVLNLSKPNPEVIEVERRIPVRDGTSITIRFHSPRIPPNSGSPIFVMLHSGGYCIGGLDNRIEDCRMFVEKWGFVVINVDYRLAPEHPFPIPIYDAYDAVKWAAANALELHANPAAGFIVGGNSTGASLAASISLLARDEGLSPPLTGVLLSVPTVIYPSVIPEKYRDVYLAREQNANAPYYLNRLNEVFQAAFKPDLTSFLASPLLHPAGHHNLPPAYIQICGLDPARDDGFIYDNILREAGNKTLVDIYPGLPHAFWAFLPQLSTSKKYADDMKSGISWLLREGKQTKE